MRLIASILLLILLTASPSQAGPAAMRMMRVMGPGVPYTTDTFETLSGWTHSSGTILTNINYHSPSYSAEMVGTPTGETMTKTWTFPVSGSLSFWCMGAPGQNIGYDLTTSNGNTGYYFIGSSNWEQHTFPNIPAGSVTLTLYGVVGTGNDVFIDDVRYPSP